AQTLIQLQKLAKSQKCERPVARSTITKSASDHEENTNLVENELDQKALVDIDTEDLCNFVREDIIGGNKTSSYRFLTTFWNCGVIAGYDEMLMTTDMRRVLRRIMDIL
ncbi:unnamed protein product, partial [Didymodactylos carnosus]